VLQGTLQLVPHACCKWCCEWCTAGGTDCTACGTAGGTADGTVGIYHWNLASTSTSSYRWAALSQLKS
jgi:hypothetical protein